MKMPPICTRPAIQGLVIVRKSGVHRNCAVARNATASPNVPHTCASIGAFSSGRMTPKWTTTPATASNAATSGSDSSGSSPRQRPEPEGGEHGEHQELAVREVYDFHEPKN